MIMAFIQIKLVAKVKFNNIQEYGKNPEGRVAIMIIIIINYFVVVSMSLFVTKVNCKVFEVCQKK